MSVTLVKDPWPYLSAAADAERRVTFAHSGPEQSERMRTANSAWRTYYSACGYTRRNNDFERGD